MGFPEDTRRAVLHAYGYLCGIPGCSNMAEQFHHILPDTKVNNKLYPLYTQSPFNCLPICTICHMNKPLPKHPQERLIRIFEDYLNSI